DGTSIAPLYYGGTKLGAVGLIRAYSGAVSNALQTIGLVERKRMQELYLTVPYPLSGKVENDLRESSYILKDISYMEHVTFICLVPVDQKETFLQQFTEATNGQGVFLEKEQTFIEISI